MGRGLLGEQLIRDLALALVRRRGSDRKRLLHPRPGHQLKLSAGEYWFKFKLPMDSEKAHPEPWNLGPRSITPLQHPAVL